MQSERTRDGLDRLCSFPTSDYTWRLAVLCSTGIGNTAALEYYWKQSIGATGVCDSISATLDCTLINVITRSRYAHNTILLISVESIVPN